MAYAKQLKVSAGASVTNPFEGNVVPRILITNQDGSNSASVKIANEDIAVLPGETLEISGSSTSEFEVQEAIAGASGDLLIRIFL